MCWISSFALLFWTANAIIQYNVTDFDLRNNEWWRIACLLNSTKGTGTLQITVYSQNSSVLMYGKIYFGKPNDQRVLVAYNPTTLYGPPPSSPVSASPYLDGYIMRVGYKLNGSYFAGTTFDGWEAAIASKYTVEDIAYMTITTSVGSNIYSCFTYLECYRSS